MIYAVFENGIEENEWWLLETFLMYEEAKDFVNVMIEVIEDTN